MIANLTNTPQNLGAPFACMIQQTTGSAIRPIVILRALMQARIGALLFETWIEIGRHTFEAPSLVGNAFRRVVAVGAISGALAYQAECNAADIEEVSLQTGPYLALVEPLTWLDSEALNFIGNETTIEVGVNPAGNGALSVGIEQDDTSVFGARVKIEALFESGYVELGRYAFAAPAPGPGRRVVALAAVPGALSYRITAASLEGTGVRPYALIGPYKNLSSPLTWLVNGAPPVPATSTQPITVTYVAPNGDDATGERGNYDRPFLTIDAAFAVMLDGDTLMIAPGNYAPCTVPRGLTCSMIGMGNADCPTVSILSDAGPALDWSPLGSQALTVRNVHFQTTDGAAFAFQALGDGITNDHQLVMENCRFQSAATAAALLFFLNAVTMRDCSGDIVITDCNSALVDGQSSGDLFLEAAEPIPAPVFHTGYFVKNSRIADLTQADNARVEADQGCFCALLSTRAGAAPVGPSGHLYYRGEAEDIDLVIDDGVDRRIRMQGALVFGSAQLTSTAAVDNVTIDARGANFATVQMGNAIGAAGEFILDIRGGSVASYALSSFDTECKVDRDSGSGRLSIANGAASYTFSSLGGAIFGPAYPNAAQVAYTIAPSVPPALAGEAVTITTSNGDGFDATSGYAAPQDCDVLFIRFE